MNFKSAFDFETLSDHAQRLALMVSKQDAVDGGSATVDLPSVNCTLAQVLEDAQQLHARVIHNEKYQQNAELILASKGIELKMIIAQLDSVNQCKVFATTVKQSKENDATEIENFLNSQQSEATQQIMTDVSRLVRNSMQTFKMNQLKREWQERKVTQLDAVIGPSQYFINLKQAVDQPVYRRRTVLGDLSELERAYYMEVVEYNENTLTGRERQNLIEKFANVAAGFRNAQANDMWQLLQYIVPANAEQRNVRYFVEQSSRFLEIRFCEYLTYQMYGKKQFSSDKLDLRYIIEEYVHMHMLKDQLIVENCEISHEVPLWVLVYHCLRCGQLELAINYLLESQENHIFAQLLEHMVRGQKPSNEITGQLKLNYLNCIINGKDQYKKLTYCLMLGYDPEILIHDMVSKLDDYLWVRLKIMCNCNDQPLEHNYVDLQRYIIEQHGEKYFRAECNLHNYFQALIVTAQFEIAIELLSRCDEYLPHAVHMGLALHELGWLRKTRSVDQPMLSVDIEDPPPVRRFNLTRLLRLYVCRFQRNNPLEALHYYYFLRDYVDLQLRDFFVVCAINVAIDSGAYFKIFGNLDRPDGKHQGGLLQHFKYDSVATAVAVAKHLAAHGMVAQSIQVYDIAGMHEIAIQHLYVLISQALPNWSTLPAHERQQLTQLLFDFDERHNAGKIVIGTSAVVKLKIFKDLLQLFECSADNNLTNLFVTLKRSKLLPMTMSELENCIKHCKQLDVESYNAYTELMLATMKIYERKFKQINCCPAHVYLGSCRYKKLSELMESAHVLNVMAMSLPHRLPGEFSQPMSKMEMEMHKLN